MKRFARIYLCIFAIHFAMPALAEKLGTSNAAACEDALMPLLDAKVLAQKLGANETSVFLRSPEIQAFAFAVESRLRRPLLRPPPHVSPYVPVRNLARALSAISKQMTEKLSREELFSLNSSDRQFLEKLQSSTEHWIHILEAQSGKEDDRIPRSSITLEGINEVRKSMWARVMKRIISGYLPNAQESAKHLPTELGQTRFQFGDQGEAWARVEVGAFSNRPMNGWADSPIINEAFFLRRQARLAGGKTLYFISLYRLPPALKAVLEREQAFSQIIELQDEPAAPIAPN